MLEMTSNPKKASGFTHSGVFHADDVFSTAFMMRYYSGILASSFRVMRVPNWPIDAQTNPAAIVYDIGMGKFDHHGEQVYRENGVPYASFGKLWKEYGLHYVSKRCGDLGYTDAMWVANKFDSILVQGIDAVDCGAMPKADYPAQAMSISTLIANMNPEWDATGALAVESVCFSDAVRMADEIIQTTLKRLVSTAKARRFVWRALDNANISGTIITLDRFCPWQEELINGTHPNADKVLYILYPSNRNPGYWKWQVVPTVPGGFEQRCHVPAEWCGKKDQELYMASGFEGATFVHASGFLGECKTQEDARNMVGAAIVEAVKRGELIQDGNSIIRNPEYPAYLK